MIKDKSTLSILLTLSAVIGFIAIDDYVWIEAQEPVVTLIPVDSVARGVVVPPAVGQIDPDDIVLVDVFCGDTIGEVPSNQTAMNPFMSYSGLLDEDKIQIVEDLTTLNDGSFGGAFMDVINTSNANVTVNIGVECYVNAP